MLCPMRRLLLRTSSNPGIDRRSLPIGTKHRQLRSTGIYDWTTVLRPNELSFRFPRSS